MKRTIIIAVAGTLLGCGVCLTRADESSRSVAQAQQKVPQPNFNRMRQAVLRGPLDKSASASLTALFDDVSFYVQQLSGKTYWTEGEKRKEDDPDVKRFAEAINALSSKVGIEAAAAVFFDSTHDDFVRNVSLGALTRRENYSSRYLPLLASVLISIPDDRDPMASMHGRMWGSPESFRITLAKKIGITLGVDVSPKVNLDARPYVSTIAAKNPKQWLRYVLANAKPLPQNANKGQVIDEALRLTE